MLRKMLGWGGGDVNVPCTCTHVGCYARCWVGVGGMLTFLALAHMLDATQDAGLGQHATRVQVQGTLTSPPPQPSILRGGMLTFLALAHVGRDARCWVGVGGMLTFLALAHMLHATQDAGLGWLALNGHESSTVCFSLHELLQRMVAKLLLERK